VRRPVSTPCFVAAALEEPVAAATMRDGQRMAAAAPIAGPFAGLFVPGAQTTLGNIRLNGVRSLIVYSRL
jgi:hypothetical protein